jgi:hypothetical protein
MSEKSLEAPTLPPYTEHAADETIELTSLTSWTSSSASSSTAVHLAATDISSSSLSSIPTYADSTVLPNSQLQIQTPGKACLSLPTPQRPDPIPIFTLTPSGNLDRPLYLSIRPTAHSGSCFLTRADDETGTPLTTTHYRFGPGRPPVVTLKNPAHDRVLSHGHPQADRKGSNEDQSQSQSQEGGEGEESFEILDRSLFTRAVRFQVPSLGSFGWRYASARELVAADADSMLVCEVFLRDPDQTISGSCEVHGPGHGPSHSFGARLGLGKHGDKDNVGKKEKKKKKESGHRIASLIRNEAYRSPGSGRSSAGNGGRLILDLGVFDDKVRERVQWLVATTALVMLKREVDRRRAQQVGILAAVVS